MVTSRTKSNSLTEVQRKTTLEMLKMLGRTDINLITHTKTTNTNGRLNGDTETTTVLSNADLQFVSVRDKQWLDLGFANVGDGVLYALYSETLVPELNEILVDSVYWELSKQVEGETIDGNLIYQAWIVKRIPEV